ncbi:MAG: DUF4340 domain-containing protein [Planctomycetota bacterium]|nr:MAG: DUF4340 domain-containing protein [Planctomycetota bacterium]
MNTTNRTLTFGAVAAFAVLSAMGVKYINRPVTNADFADVGQEFFAEFTDPLKATSLSVAKYDTEAKEPMAFSVKQDDKGLWVIPSHHNYPAEAADRLARTASSFIGAKKMALQSRNKDDWGRYGVADPDDDVAVDLAAKDGEKDESRGTRVTLRDVGGNPLVDLIIGKPVEGQNQRYYVRQPEKNNVYIAEIGTDLSAKFSDWIEPDLLKLSEADIVQVIVDKYSVDEDKGEILRGDTLEFDKNTTDNKWTVTGLDVETESVKEAPVNDLAKNLDQLKIVGVRPKPEGLNADLTVSEEMAGNPVVMQILQADMQRQGFFIARGENGQKKLVSNEGELVAGTKNGVRYTLYFGEVARGTAKDLETGLHEKSGVEGDAAKADVDEEKQDATADGSDDLTKPAGKPGDVESGPRRYLLVKVDFDEALMGEKPVEPVAPEMPAILNEGVIPSETPGDAKAETPANDAQPSHGVAPENAVPADAAPPLDDAATPKEEAPLEAGEKPADESASTEAGQDEASEPAPVESACDEPAAADVVDPEPTSSEPADAAANDSQATTIEPATIEPATSDETPEIIPANEVPSESAKVETDTPAVDGAEKPVLPATTPQEPAPPADPKAEAQKQYLQALGKYEAEKSGFADALKSWEDRSKDGKKLAKELSARFEAWYYVISADSFEKLRPARVDVVGPKEAAKPGDASMPPHFDKFPGGIPGVGGIVP